MVPLLVLKETPFLLYDISGANILLPLKLFLDLVNKKDILKSPNILQDDNITNQPRSSCQSRCFNYQNPKRLGKAILVL